MSEARWQPEKIDAIAAEYRAAARRYRKITVTPTEIANLCDKLAEIMRDGNAMADEIADLNAKLEKAGSPKFAPFAPRTKAR